MDFDIFQSWYKKCHYLYLMQTLNLDPKKQQKNASV